MQYVLFAVSSKCLQNIYKKDRHDASSHTTSRSESSWTMAALLCWNVLCSCCYWWNNKVGRYRNIEFILHYIINELAGLKPYADHANAHFVLVDMQMLRNKYSYSESNTQYRSWCLTALAKKLYLFVDGLSN